MERKRNSETAGRDNCGHDPGLTTKAPAGKPPQAQGVEPPDQARDSTQSQAVKRDVCPEPSKASGDSQAQWRGPYAGNTDGEFIMHLVQQRFGLIVV